MKEKILHGQRRIFSRWLAKYPEAVRTDFLILAISRIRHIRSGDPEYLKRLSKAGQTLSGMTEKGQSQLQMAFALQNDFADKYHDEDTNKTIEYWISAALEDAEEKAKLN